MGAVPSVVTTVERPSREGRHDRRDHRRKKGDRSTLRPSPTTLLGAVTAAVVVTFVVVTAVLVGGVAGSVVGTTDLDGEVLAEHGVTWDETATGPDSAVPRTMFYDGDDLTAVSWDTTGDGRSDLWFRFASGLVLDREIADLDGDGDPDEVLDVADDGTIIVVEAAVTRDGDGDGGIPIWPLAVGGGIVVAGIVALLLRRRSAAAVVLVTLVPLAVGEPAARAAPDAVVDDDCDIVEAVFEAEWERYSDFDDRIPIESASWEVQQFHATGEQIGGLLLDRWELEVEQAYHAELRRQLREYKQALVRDQKANLLRAFWRLAALTYNTVQSARGAGGSIEKLIAPDVLVEQIGAAVKLYDQFTPQLEEAEQTAAGAVEGVAWDGMKDALESAGDPATIATGVVTSSIGQVDSLLPSLELSDAEIDVLRTQHLENRALDAALAESYREARERRDTIGAVDDQIAAFEADLEGFRAAEKDRVRQLLIAECERGRDDGSDGAADDPTVTTDSIPDYDPVLGTWREVDGLISVEFRDDGSYTSATNDERSDGRYKLVTEDGSLDLLWLDPDDPTGFTFLLRSAVRRDGDTLILTTAGNDVVYERGPLIEIGEQGPPGRYELDSSAVYNFGGMYRVRIHGNQLPDCPGTQGATTEADTHDVDLTFDLGAGTVDGTASLTYLCPTCRDVETLQRSTATLSGLEVTFTQDGSTWRFTGTGTVDLALEVTRDDGTSVCTWRHGGAHTASVEGMVETVGRWASLNANVNRLSTDLATEPQWQWTLLLMFEL